MQFEATNDSLLMTQHLKNHTLFHGTYLYRCHKRVPFPFPPASPDIEIPALCINIFIYEKIWEKKFRADTFVAS